MIDINKAIEIAQKFIDEMNKNSSDSCQFALDENQIRESEYNHVYVFYSQSKIYLETRNLEDILIGPGPNLIDKKNGYIESYGSAYCEEAAVLDYYQKKGYKLDPVLQDYFEERKRIESSEEYIREKQETEELLNEVLSQFDNNFDDGYLSQDEIDKKLNESK